VVGSGRGIILNYYSAIRLRGHSKTKEKACNEIGVRAEIRSGHVPHTNWNQFTRFEPVPKHQAIKVYRGRGGSDQRILKLTKYGGGVVASRSSRPTTGEYIDTN
jgi:hypothetical protein